MKRHFFFRRVQRLVALGLAAALFFVWENTSLQTARFTAKLPALPAGFDGCRVTVLADLHGARFGPENQKLFEAVRRTKPEYIFFLGDLEDSIRGAEPGYAEEVASGLSAIAPTYYITGNHEWAIGSVPELKRRLESGGVHVLSNAFTELERGGDRLVLAGIDDPNGYADQKTPEALAEEVRDAAGEGCWLLLAHRNNLFPTRYARLGADLVLSGHGHGGLIRLPFTDGLVSTDHTFFPSWTAGFYELGGARLFVTRGLGNSGPTFRLFNRPEVAVLTLRRG